MTISRINFMSIPVADQDRAIAFYTGHLGFEGQTDAPYTDGWRWIFLKLPGADTRLRRDGHPSAQRLDRAAHDIHADTSAGKVGDLIGGRKTGLKDQIVHVLVA